MTLRAFSPRFFSMIGVTRRLVEQRLEHLVLVGIDGALDDDLAEAPGGIDEHDPVESGFGVDREHDARAGEIRAHHLLNADGKSHLEMVEPLRLAIADRAIGEERGVAAPAGIEQRIRSPEC